MSSSSRSREEHYAEAERLLGVAESPAIDPGIRDLSAMLVIGHALLANIHPRRLRKWGRYLTATSGSTPQQRWLRGEDG